MNARSCMVKIGFFAVPVLVILAAFPACSRHPFNNIVDPEGYEYQGFKTVVDANDIVPESPYDGSGVYFFPELIWSRSTAAVAYELQISSTASFSSIAYKNNALTDNRCAPRMSDLDASSGLAGQSYFWRVRAKNAAGVWCDWSATSFQLAGKSPDGLKPSDKALISTGIVAWSAVSEAAAYEVQIASTAEALKTAPRVNVTGSSYTIPAGTVSVGEERFWRVRPVDSRGEPGFWSAARSFRYSSTK